MFARSDSGLLVPQEQRVVCPNDPDYELPISIVDPTGFTENDMELVQAMAMYSPRSTFKAGDLAYITDIPMHIKHRHRIIPRIWKVRFVISAWAYELCAIAMQHGGNLGMDRAISLLEDQKLSREQYRKPVIFAHGYPHGKYPRTAAWLPERTIKKFIYREPNAPWQTIVEEAGAKYIGYDPSRVETSFMFSLAPEDYGSGSNIGRPFQHEEAVTHAMCSSGLEETLFIPIILGEKSKVRDLDPDHDSFGS